MLTSPRQNLPESVLDAIEKYKPRYIMNLAIRDEGLWFMYFYHNSRRYGHDSKWEPNKPSKNSPIGEVLVGLRQEKRDQVSCCSFGATDDMFFIRATEGDGTWCPHLGGVNVPVKLKLGHYEILRNEHLRAVTFGENDGWIAYGTSIFKWSTEGLPDELLYALNLGSKNGWIINVRIPSQLA